MTSVATAPTPTPTPIRSQRRVQSLMDRAILVPALGDSFKKLSPRWQARNPVMFVVGIGAVMTTYAFITGLFNHDPNVWFVFQIALWLWFTVLFANFAEAVAEGRGKAQAATLRKTRSDTVARRLVDGKESACRRAGAAQGRHRGLRGRRRDPQRRNHPRGHRVRRRVGHHW